MRSYHGFMSVGVYCGEASTLYRLDLPHSTPALISKATSHFWGSYLGRFLGDFRTCRASALNTRGFRVLGSGVMLTLMTIVFCKVTGRCLESRPAGSGCTFASRFPLCDSDKVLWILVAHTLEPSVEITTNKTMWF